MLLFSPIYFTVVKAILLHDPHHCHEELLVLQKELMAKICESTDFVTSPSLMFFFFLFINQILVCIYKYFEKKKEDAGSVHNFLVFFLTKKQKNNFLGELRGFLVNWNLKYTLPFSGFWKGSRRMGVGQELK